MVPVGLGFRALKGGSVVVGVAADGEPRVVLSSFLATAAEGDRLSLEPYHVAAEMERGPQGRASAEAEAAVAEGRKRQDKLAAAGLIPKREMAKLTWRQAVRIARCCAAVGVTRWNSLETTEAKKTKKECPR